jgi:putative transposase
MDARGRALDNIFVERLWRSIKYEEVYLKEYASMGQAVDGLGAYLRFYHTRRPHQALKNQTPSAVYWEAERQVSSRPACPETGGVHADPA